MQTRRQISRLRDTIASSLRIRVLILVLLGFAAVAAPAYLAFNWIVASTVVQLGTLFAEKQILYDRYRGLEALMREVSLAETLAGSQSIRDWANDEANPELKRRGIAELEHFRQSFADRSYFFAIGESGNYYFNDAANSYAGDQYRYTVSPDNPRDAWYYSTVALGEGCHLNVDNDANLRVTKVWMNCVIREGRRVLGVLGTGIDLTSFIQEVVNVPQVGVTSMFVDRQGAVQAHRDQDMVDLRSLTAEMSAKRTVFSLVDKPEDRAALQALMDEVAAGNAVAQSRFMTMGGKEMLVGVGYLDKLGWFNVTLMDIDAIIDKRLFLPIGLLLASMMGLVTAIMVLVFKRAVLDRLKRLELVVHSARQGEYGPALSMADARQDEVGRLSAAFTEMAVAVTDNTRLLEARVRARTEELETLASRDAQTGIANRRGFVAAFAGAATGQRHGLVLVDIDHFKSINDNYGHSAGDAVIVEVSRRIVECVGEGNVCARWGGDEFIILLRDSAPHLLRAGAFGVMAAINDRPVELAGGKSAPVTASVGACLVEPGDTIETATEMADAALYMAKGEGRNRVVIFDPDAAEPPRAARQS
ncbi:diguanylate cyclase [Devosia sp. Root436]|jgi:diguanylate cyclase (GGDEF)-like protein|uniref:sensor domain-containing diguanylate cyclase n=1 Tax=Devosia sp. Root436 TaxID=1736537 RepID=UPI0006FB7A84|nr:diguanylate cyclase [Devosia sp. Root436]KQX35631.1 diguanylate cyclase [Devosia sp. Root436]